MSEGEDYAMHSPRTPPRNRAHSEFPPASPSKRDDEGKYIYSTLYCRYSNNKIDLDIAMASPPKTKVPSYGASRTTGGVLRGRAHGNHFNQADTQAEWSDKVYQGHGALDAEPGKIMVYVSHESPANIEVTTTKPMYGVSIPDILDFPKTQNVILRSTRDYAPIRSMLFLFLSFQIATDSPHSQGLLVFYT